MQNANHIERYRQSSYNFTQLEFLQPHVHDSFQRLVAWVEKGIAPPVDNPAFSARPERCAALLAR